MRLYAAIVPPQRVRDELADLVASVAPGTRELVPVPPAAMRIPVTNFGNVLPLASSVHCCSKVSRCRCMTLYKAVFSGSRRV